MGTYTVSSTPSGHKTLIYRDSRETRLHSAYDPLTEARRAVEAYSKGRGSCILVCGLALGYHVRLLREKFPDTQVVVIEKDPEVVKIAADTCPDNIAGTHIITSSSDITAAFEERDIAGFRGVRPYYHRPSYMLDHRFYDSLVAETNRYLSSRLSDLLTRFEFETRWAENIFRNVPALFTSTPAAGLFGAFEGYTGIIISAGPSLRRNVELIRGALDRALVVAVDTAYPVLLRLGIHPHLVMTIDAQKHSLRHFLARRGRSVLLADMVSCPRISETYQGPVVFGTTAKYYTDSSGRTRREPTPAMDWFEDHMAPVGDIQSGGSVATSAFDLMLSLGCRPIVLVGQDLAYTGREIHCTGTHHNDGWLPGTSRFLNLETINQKVIRKRKIKYVTSYGGRGTVISDYVFDLYRGWFEDSARIVRFPVINATEGGARIQNTVEKPLSEIIGAIPVPKRPPGEVLLSRLGQHAGGMETLVDALNTAGDAAARLSERAESLCGSGDRAVDELFSMIADSGLQKLFNPYLRRTNAYLARHDSLPEEKAAALLLNDIAAASRTIHRLLGETARRLAKTSR